MENKRELQPEQKAAAHEINKHVSVTAGPGSGKTTVLVERYLEILRRENHSIDQIVAITFTNRAANEMRERLRSELNKILQTVPEKERPRWLNYKRTLDGAIITTIHGFCARLLREFPLEAHVDPQFVLLDEHRAAMLLDSVTEEVLSEFISSGHPEVSRLTLGIGRSKLAVALAEIYRNVRGQGLAIEELAAVTANSHQTEEAYARVFADVDAAMERFLSARRNTEAARENQIQVTEQWSAIRETIASLPTAEGLADYCRAIENLRKVRPQARSSLAEQVLGLDEIIWGPDLSGQLPRVCFDVFAQRFALETVNILGRIDQRLNEEKQKLAALDFDDLQLRALSLLQHPEVVARTSERYRFFLVDEFQDTNNQQKVFLERLAFSNTRKPANLFIVGDQKQSVYGFRGADVDVFQQMTTSVVASGGEAMQLRLNFRSQPALVQFFNLLFAKIFEPGDECPEAEREQLGYVAHEPSEAKRDITIDGPLVELMITARRTIEDPGRAELDLRELDAEQLAFRLRSLVDIEGYQFSDIALLFRAMTQVGIYESAFRRANIPYQTVLGRGFYERPEITDLIQLLRFLDNKTDEIALAAILRSPVCGISDNALLALRCAPHLDNNAEEKNSQPLRSNRNLYRALKMHRGISFISDDEHQLLDRAMTLLHQLIARRHHYSIEDLLRFAVEQSEFTTVIAANFDGAQRLANVERLFTLAARFEASGTHLIRDFVRYVEEFEAIGSRESEGQIDEAADAVRLMTIHQAKGLEFPVVVLPDLNRLNRTPSDSWFALDRHHGLTLKVPDGRGRSVTGMNYDRFEQRQQWREQFESMRLLYVAATRAKDRLLLSGATEELDQLSARTDSWLRWIWKSLELTCTETSVVPLSDDLSMQFTLNLAEHPLPAVPVAEPEQAAEVVGDSLAEAFPLLASVDATPASGEHRFSVTQMINFQRCPRQYYFDRVLKLPTAEELAAWNDAEAPEPPANLTATLKGAVIHRFCERYTSDSNAEAVLTESFAEVVQLRQADLADRLGEIDYDAALVTLLPLIRNYLESDVFTRIAKAETHGGAGSLTPFSAPGLWSELPFKLRRPLGVLSGAIDKLLVSSLPDGGLQVEIIDFKTNRIKLASPAVSKAASAGASTQVVRQRVSIGKQGSSNEFQFSLNFESDSTVHTKTTNSKESAAWEVAQDYQLQMQSYALAVRQLCPSLAHLPLRVTLHFLEPNVEISLPPELLTTEACSSAIDNAMAQIVASSLPEDYVVNPSSHCRSCNFLTICSAGSDWLRTPH